MFVLYTLAVHYIKKNVVCNLKNSVKNICIYFFTIKTLHAFCNWLREEISLNLVKILNFLFIILTESFFNPEYFDSALFYNDYTIVRYSKIC